MFDQFKKLLCTWAKIHGACIKHHSFIHVILKSLILCLPRHEEIEIKHWDFFPIWKKKKKNCTELKTHEPQFAVQLILGWKGVLRQQRSRSARAVPRGALVAEEPPRARCQWHTGQLRWLHTGRSRVSPARITLSLGGTATASSSADRSSLSDRAAARWRGQEISFA